MLIHYHRLRKLEAENKAKEESEKLEQKKPSPNKKVKEVKTDGNVG